MSRNYTSRSGRPRRDHFTMVPHVVERLGLDVYAFRLYEHLRSVIGEGRGACWQSTATLAASCCMSGGKVSEAKRTLVAEDLISVEKRPGRGGLHDHITLKPIWERNRRYVAGLDRATRGEREGQGNRAEVPSEARVQDVNAANPGIHPVDTMCSPCETKKNPAKKTPHGGRKNGRDPEGEDTDELGEGRPTSLEAPTDPEAPVAQWCRVLESVRRTTTQAAYHQLFAGTICLGYDDDGRTLCIGATSSRAVESLSTSRMRTLVARAMREAGVQHDAVTFVVRDGFA